jgi:hypothetical protein
MLGRYYPSLTLLLPLANNRGKKMENLAKKKFRREIDDANYVNVNQRALKKREDKMRKMVGRVSVRRNPFISFIVLSKECERLRWSGGSR